MVEAFIVIVTIYFLSVFVLSRFFVPHLDFRKEKLPENLPVGMIEQITKLKNQSNSAVEFLQLAYDYLGSKYRSERFDTLFKFNYLFKNLAEIWNMSGYTPCTQSNSLMRIFLMQSGFFADEEIKIRHNFVNFCIHQYLQVKVNGEWMDVDAGEKQGGMPLGKHLKFFG